MKITKLTPEQTARMADYVDKWTKIGLSTEPTNKERATVNVKRYYEAAGLTPPEKVIFCASPQAAMITANILASDEYNNCKDKSQFNYKAAIKKAATQFNSNYAGGNLWAGWQAFYDFFKHEVNVPGLDIIQPTLDLSQDVGWIYPYSTFVVLSEKPTILKTKNNRLHSDVGPALSYPDGFEIYALNGTHMPAELMSKGKENITAAEILNLKNAEQRMQGMKWLGLGHFFDSLDKTVLDTHGTYELLLIDLADQKCEFLKMVNPSTGEIHLEGVLGGIKTVKDALAWRNGLEYWITPEILT